MSPRDTRTGDVLEDMILPSLARGGYSFQKRQNVGRRPGDGKHIVDAIATKNGRSILISSKWQQVGGTAEQKIPFELICLMKAIRDGLGKYEKAYLVLGGEGWRLRRFYVEGGLNEFIQGTEQIRIITLETFVALANKSEL
jgi:PD-(D/E)XK nuclease superfamily protein